MSTQEGIQKTESRAGAGLAGVGSGTSLVAIAQALPDTNGLKPWLLFAAPAVSIGASAIWLWAQVEIANLVQDWRIRQIAKRLRAHLDVAIAAPKCDPEHQQDLQKRIRMLDIIIADRDLGRLKELTPVAAEDVTNFKHTIADQ